MAAAKKKTYTVAYKYGLNLRENPSTESNILKVLPYGETVEPAPKADSPDGWLAVKGGGYVMKEFLTQN